MGFAGAAMAILALASPLGDLPARIRSVDGIVQRRAVQEAELHAREATDPVVEAVLDAVCKSGGTEFNDAALLRALGAFDVALSTPLVAQRMRALRSDRACDSASVLLAALRVDSQSPALRLEVERLQKVRRLDEHSDVLGRIATSWSRERGEEEMRHRVPVWLNDSRTQTIQALVLGGIARRSWDRVPASLVLSTVPALQDEPLAPIAIAIGSRHGAAEPLAELRRMHDELRRASAEQASLALTAFAIARVSADQGDVESAIESAAFAKHGRPYPAGHTTAGECMLIADLLVDSALLPRIAAGLKDEIAARRAGAANILCFVGRRAKDYAPQLLRMARHEPNEDVREIVSIAVCWVCDASDVRDAAEHFRSDDVSAKDLAARVLASEGQAMPR